MCLKKKIYNNVELTVLKQNSLSIYFNFKFWSVSQSPTPVAFKVTSELRFLRLKAYVLTKNACMIHIIL